MNESQRNMVRMAALLDIVIAIVLGGLTAFAGLQIPLLVPVIMIFGGLGLFAITLIIK